MTTPRTVLVAAGLAVVMTAVLMATAAAVHAKHDRPAAPALIHDVVPLAPSVIDRDLSVPDAATALRDQLDAQAQQPPTF
jgi:hypothetical protein